MLHTTKRLVARTGIALVLAGALIATSSGAVQAAQESGSSSATGLVVQLGSTIDMTVAEAAYPEGPEEDRVASVAIGTLGRATNVHALATGDDAAGTVEAEAGLRRLAMDLSFARLTTGAVTASCSAGPDEAPTGDARIVNGVYAVPILPDVRFETNPEPNTVVNLPFGTGRAFLNEQTENADGSLTVNALRLELTRPLPPSVRGDVTIGSVTCAPGDAVEEPVSITARAKDSHKGRGVDGVVFEVVDELGEVVDTCVTGSECTMDDLPPGRYWVCVADVPEGYRMPGPNDVCDGPHDLEAGDSLDVTFYLDPDRRPKK